MKELFSYKDMDEMENNKSSNTDLVLSDCLLNTIVNNTVKNTEFVDEYVVYKKALESIEESFKLTFERRMEKMEATLELITIFPYNTKSSFNSNRLATLLNRRCIKSSKRSTLADLTLYCIYLGTFCLPHVPFETPLYEVLNEQYIMFLKAFDLWKSRKLHLINESKACINKLNKTFRLFSIARSVASVVDLVESFRQLLLNPGDKFANYGCSLCILGITVAETVLYKKLLMDMVANICDERDSFNSLVQKLPQNLKCRIQNETSHRTEEEVISQLQEYSLELSGDAASFVQFSLCAGMALNLPKNKISKYMLKHPLGIAVASFLIKRLISRDKPLDLGMNKMVRKTKFDGVQNFLSQTSVLGRIFLDIMNIYEYFFHMRQEDESPYSDTLVHFKNAMEQESELVDSIEKLRLSDFRIQHQLHVVEH